MRKIDLLSGRIKKVTGSDLDANRYQYLDLKNAEPDAGYPATTNSLFTSTSTGTRSWLSTSSTFSGLKVVSGALEVDEDTTFVDTTGFINTSANDLHTVLFDLDQNLGATTANALTVVVTDNTIDGNGTTGQPLTIGQGVRPTDSPYFAGLRISPHDAVSSITLNNPIRVVVSTSHDLTDGDLITFRGVGGTTQLNDNDYYVDVIDATTVDLYSDQSLTTGIDGTGGGYSAYTSGGFLIGGGYRFPTLDGTSSNYLKTDGFGQLTFDRPIQYGGTQPTNPDLGDLWYDTVTANDLLIWNGSQFISATEGGVQSAFTLRQFQGDGSTTAFDTGAPQVQKVLVFLNGIMLRLTDDFTFSSGIITFNSAPLANDTIEVLLTGDADLVGLDILGISNHDLITVDTSGNVTLVGDLDMGTNSIVNMADPVNAQDAATKAYVDSAANAVTISFAGDTGAGTVLTSTQTFNVIGTANEIETSGANQSLTIGLPDDVNITQNLTVGGYLAGPSTFTIDPATVGDNTGTVVIAGNLQIDGTTTTVNSTEMVVDDINITLASGAANAAATNGAGITIDVANATILYDQPNDYWVFNKAPYYNTLRLLTTSDLTGSDNYAYKTVTVTDTDVIYSWSETGTIVAPSNTGTLTFVSGGAIDLDVDTTQYAIRVEHTDTSTIADFTASNNTNQFLAALAMTFDTYGHVQTVSPTYSNVIFNNDFGTLTVTDTDSGYTWAATGNVGAGQTSDTATYVSGDGLNIDVDSTNKAIRWTNTDKGSSQNIIGTITVQNTTTGFSMSETGSFNASGNTDTITLIPLTGMDIDIDTTNGAFTFENTDTGSAQNIIKTVTVVDSSAGFTFTETGTFTTASNTDSFTFVQSTGIDLDIDTTNGAIRITNDDTGSSQNIFKTIAVTDTNSGYTWAESGNVVADNNSDTITFVSGTGIDLDADTTNDAILVINTDTGSSQNIVKTFSVSDTNSGYTWSETGSIVAGTNSDTITFVSGTAIDLDVDATSGAILVQHNVAGANTTISVAANTFVDEITVDAQGHVTTVGTGSVDFTTSANYAFATISAGGTNLIADSNLDTLTISAAQVDSIDGIVITGNALTDSFTIAHADTSSVSNITSANNTFISAQTYDTYGHVLTQSTNTVDFAVTENYAFKTIAVSGQNDIVADSNQDTLSLGITGTGLSITTNATSDTISFENTDKGSSQNIIKTVYVTDTNSGYTWSETGNWTANSNTDSITFVSGEAIDLDVDATNKSILVRNTDRGSVQNIFKSVVVTDTDSGYTWSDAGTINASSNTDSITFVSGTGIDIDVDPTSKAITVINTSQNTDPGSAQDIIKSIIVTDTDSGYTWSETGTYSVSGNNDAFTFVSGQGIDIDVDTTTGAIRIENPTSGSAFTESTNTGDGTTTVFSIGTGFTTVTAYVNGVLVDDGIDYTYNTVSGDATFSIAPSLGDLITFHKYTQSISAITLSSLGIVNHNEVTVDGSGNVVITGNLTVQGTTTSTSTQTLNDPVLTLGGSTPPTADDNLDRGIVFRWHDGSAAKVGFFGFDDTDYDFMFIPDSTGTNAFDPAGAGPFTLADYGGAKFKHVIGQNIRMGYTGANEIDTSSGNLTIDSAGGTVTIDDNASITGTLSVTNTATFSGTVQANNGITVDTTAFIVANTSGNVTTAGTLDVAGLASLDGGIDVDGAFTVANTSGNINTTGTLTVGNTAIFNGNVDIGSDANDTVTFNADVDSHFIPSQDVTYDLGATGSRWRDLYLSGNTIYLGTATITESNGDITIGSVEGTPIGATTPSTGAFTTLSATSTLDVGGATGIDGDFDINTDKFTVASATGNTAIAGTLSSAAATFTSAKVSDLTDNRIVIAGTNGELEDDSSFRFDGTSFDIGASGSESFTVTVSNGNVVSTGNITGAGGTLGNIRVGVTGNNEIDTSSGNLTIDSAGGTTTIDDILSVSGNAGFSSNVTIAGDLTVDTTTFAVDASANNVGIGTTTPSAKLQVVAGDNATTGPIINLAGSAVNQVESGRIRFTEGPMGASPLFQGAYIHYDGSANYLKLGTHDANSTDTADDIDAIYVPRGAARVGIGKTPAAGIELDVNGDLQTSGSATIGTGATFDTDTLVVDATNDRVGVNTATPGYALDVVGSARFQSTGDVFVRINADTDDVTESHNTHLVFMQDGAREMMVIGTEGSAGQSYTGTAANACYIMSTTEHSNTMPLQFGTASTVRMTIENDGDIGMGTTAPGRQLHVYDTGATVALKAEAGDGNQASLDLKNSEGEFRLITDAGELKIYDQGDSAYRLVIDTTGNIGVGTETVNAKLHLYTGGLGANTGVTDMLRLEVNRSDHGATPSGPAILFKDQDTNNLTNEARIKMLTVNDTDFGDNDEAASNLVFETTNGGSASDKMIITGRGDVGIGTLNPTAKLDVEGAIRLQEVNRDYVSSTLTTTTETAIATVSSTTYRSVKLMIQVTRGSEYQVSEALMLHDGTDTFITTFGTMFTGSAALATFDADLSGSTMRLLATSATTASTVYKISLTSITV